MQRTAERNSPKGARPTSARSYFRAKDTLTALFYLSVAIHALRSAAGSLGNGSGSANGSENTDDSSLPSPSGFSYSLPINLLIAAWAVRALVSEIFFLVRVRPGLPPGSFGVPFLGNLPSVLWKHDGIIFLHLIEQAEKLGSPVFFTTVLGRRLITLADSASLAWIWNTDRKSQTEVAWPPNISALMGPDSTSTATGARHRALRRLLEPFYAPKFVRNYVEGIVSSTDAELAKWHAQTRASAIDDDNNNSNNNGNNTGNNNGKSEDAYVSGDVFKLYALRMFWMSTFGEADETVLKQLHDDFKIFINGFTVVCMVRIPGLAFDEAMKARERIRDKCKELVDRFRREHPEGSDRAEKTVMGKMVYSRNDEGVGLTNDEILDNLLLLIFAGHDTTFASINTLLYHLTRDPLAMEALREEVATFREPLDYEQLKNAPVLNAIMHESWRVNPPVSAGFRKFVAREGAGPKSSSSSSSSSSSCLEYGGFRFPSDTVFNYNITLTTADDELYPSAETFRFQRFLPEGHKHSDANWRSEVDPTQGRSTYPIFGGGTHVCLGKNFAKLELRILLARIMMGYDIKTRNPKRIHAPVNGWSLEFRLEKKKKKQKTSKPKED